MTTLTTRKMSDAHEEFLAERLEGTKTRNSGAVWSDQGDGNQLGSKEHWRFGWDGKSTLGKSIGITRDMLAKIREQSRGLHPAVPLRFYGNERLTKVDEDWVVIELETFAQLAEEANKYRRIEEIGCGSGNHDFAPQESGSVPGMLIKNGPCLGCGNSPYEAGR